MSIGSNSGNDQPATAPRILLYSGLGAAWMTVFAVLFYGQVLWANGLQIPRLSVLLDLPALLGANLQSSPDARWTNVRQRLDLLAVAALVLSAAWGLGRLAIVACRVQLPDAPNRAISPPRTIGIGLSLWSLLTLGLGVAGVLSPIVFRALAIAAVAGGIWCARREHRTVPAIVRDAAATRSPAGSRLDAVMLVTVAPFVIAMLLGSLLPPVDFDVKEYHLQGPKEYFQDGRIRFLPHNVYTSFPFLTEMLSLSAMALRGDWFRGALAGQGVLMAFAVITAAVVHALTRHVAGERPAWPAVLVWLTLPWTYRISTIAYTEGALACYLTLTVLALIHAADAREHSVRRFLVGVGVTGFFAGSAAACKYPGVVSAVIPIGLAIGWLSFQSTSVGGRWRTALLTGSSYSVGVLLAFGPWLLKNLVETGNPVYPLLWSIFGGASFDADVNLRWLAAHAPPTGLWREPALVLPDLWQRVQDIVLRSDWQSALIGGLAPLSLLAWRRPGVRRLWLYVAWLLLTWCWLTHRLDRFWVPMLPFLCVLAGIGLDALWQGFAEASSGHIATSSALTRWGLLAARTSIVVFVTLSLGFNLAFITTGLAGFNGFLLDEQVAQDRAVTSSIALCRSAGLSHGGKVLFVGEAAVFDADFPCVYNTVFDDSWFELWSAAPAVGAAHSDRPLRPISDIRRTLAEHGITHVCVQWREILRYRLPGSYGFTDFVHPDRFDDLIAGGLLERTDQTAIDDWSALSPSEQTEVTRWAPKLRWKTHGRDLFRGVEVYRVKL